MTRAADGERPDAFTRVHATEEPVSALPPAAARTGYAVYRAGDGFEAAIPLSVIERCIAWGRKAEPNEWYGLAVGRLCVHGGVRHVVVLGVVPDPEAKGLPASVETTADSEFRTRTSARVLYPDGVILGWVHGHVRHGVRFSPTDLATQRTWTQPHALGIVVDPWDPKRLAVYRGPESEPMRLVDEPEPPEPPPARPSRLRRAAGRARLWAARRPRLIELAVALGIVAFLGRAVWRLSDEVRALEAAELARGKAAATAVAPPGPTVTAGSAPEALGVCRANEDPPGVPPAAGGGT